MTFVMAGRTHAVWLVFWLALASVAPTYAQSRPPAAAVATAHPLATAVGHEILAAGGNAFDAAVAVSAALAVVEPSGSGLGGGGFWLLQRADSRAVMIDGRERAPGAAGRDMYLDEHGVLQPQRSLEGALAAAIPGEPAALAHIATRYGKLSLRRNLAPAIRLARAGVAVTEDYRRWASIRLATLRAAPEAARLFLLDNEVPPLGHLIRQPDLAATLEQLGRHGARGFYRGSFAQRLVDGVRAAGGIWTLQDLADYKVVERAPLQATYRGIRLTTVAPPSSGGVALIQALNVLAGYDLTTLTPAGRTHFIVEALRRAYRDRAEYLGDPSYTTIPLAQLTHPLYAAGLRAGVHPTRATPSAALPPIAPPAQGDHTTHFSILDRAGNRVAATLSINLPFGSGLVIPGTGVLLNDEMDDFSAQPGRPNAYGLVGNEANAIAAGKRPLSSMTPTFLESDHGVAILGTPGGSRIISMVLLAILDYADGAPPAHWVSRGRLHHQYLPDVIQYEPAALDDSAVVELQQRGHTLQRLDNPYGNMQAILWDRVERRVLAAADPRGGGAAVVK